MRQVNPGVKLTSDDLLLFPDDGRRHELVDGEHCVTPSPDRRHQAILVNLLGMIWGYLQHRPVGRVFGAPFDVVFSEFDVVQPDLVYICRERFEQITTPEHVRGAPDLIVEVGSPSTRKRDETAKLRLYERAGVVEYWVVDPELDTFKVYRRAGARYERVAELTLEKGDALTTPLLPGLEMPLAKIFDER